MEECTSRIRVLIADDHTMVRQGLTMLLQTQPDITVIGEASDGSEAIRMAHEFQPDIVVMDIAMPNVDGLEATRAIKSSLPNVQILALTMHEGEEYFFKILAAGASGYVLKRAAANDLISAIHAVARGEVFLYPSIAKKLVADYLSRTKAEPPGGDTTADALTQREHQILALIAEGLSNREIAERLTLSLSTVQTHYTHIIEKLNLRNRTELVKYALRHGLIQDAP